MQTLAHEVSEPHLTTVRSLGEESLQNQDVMGHNISPSSYRLHSLLDCYRWAVVAA